jgi:hypothetical protein
MSDKNVTEADANRRNKNNGKAKEVTGGGAA